MSLRKLLEEIGAELTERFEYINRGGCAVVASLVGKHLSMLTDVEVLVTNPRFYHSEDITTARKNHDTSNFKTPRDWNKVGVEFSHVVLKAKFGRRWMVFDSDGVKPYKAGDYLKGTLSLDEVQSISSHAEGWNDMFDRDQIPAMKRCINKIFKQNAAVAT